MRRRLPPLACMRSASTSERLAHRIRPVIPEQIIGKLANARPHVGIVLITGLAFIAIVGLVDRATGPELALSIIYLLPVGLCAWFGGRGVGIVIALASAAMWTFLDISKGRPYSNPLIPYWNGAVRFGIFGIVAALLNIIHRLNSGLEEQVRQRTAALEEEIKNRKEVERVATEISAYEQQRLGADLHDQLAGHLAGLAFHAKALAESLSKRSEP